MAENETLDLGSRYSRRWQQWRAEFASEKSVSDLTQSAFEKLVRTIRNLQRLFSEENNAPLSAVLDAVTGVRGDIAEIVRNAKFGRDYLQLFQQQANQALDRQEVLARVLHLTFERFADQAVLKYVPDGNSNLLALLPGVKEELYDRIEPLTERLAREPDVRPKQPRKTASQRADHEIEQLSKTVLPTSSRVRTAKPTQTVVVEF